MIMRPNDPYFVEFTTSSPTSGHSVDADSLPTVVADRNGVTDGSFSLTVWNRSTGVYAASGLVPAGYLAQDNVSIIGTAIVEGKTGKANIGNFLVDTKIVSEVDTDVLTVLTQVNSLPSSGTITIVLDNQGYTTTRAAFLDQLDNFKFDPDSNVLSNAVSGNLDLFTGVVNINLAQVLSSSQTTGTVGRALQLARGQAKGTWVVDEGANTLTLYDADGTTELGVFDLTPHGGEYTTRTSLNTE